MTTSALVPAVLPFAIDGHPFLIDSDYERQTVQVIRQQADTSTEAGEQSLTPLGLWRRSQESWHHGAGQDFLDGRQGETPTDPHRFRSSKGIDCWTRGQVSLLHPTLRVWSTSNTNLFLVTAQNDIGLFVLYVADGNELYGNGLPYSAVNSLALQQGTGWSATNATIAANGVFFQLTATAAAAVSATSPTGINGFPVDPGREYGFAVGSFYVSGGGGKIPRVNVTWYTAAGATISSTTPVAASTDDDPSQVDVIADAVAPATAAFASITVSYTANWANGEIHRIPIVSFGPLDDVPALGAPDGWFTANIQAGEAAQPIQSLATNGSYVWAALGTSGLHRTFAGGAASTANVPAAPGGGQISLVGYANGFLLAAGSTVSTTGRNTLWRVDDPLGTPSLSVIKTHDNGFFRWEGIGPGRNCVYVWGNSGGNGEVYKILFDPNTGTLSAAASFATYLPDGETIHALQFYAGGIIMGTGRGLRIGQADGAGNIDYGPLIETDWPVRCLEPQGRFCWFGWSQYDTSTSGLGRIDLGYLTDTLTPAWASDLMTYEPTETDTVSCVTFAPYGYTENQRPPVRVFTVAGEGVYIEDPGSRELEGRINTGTIRFSTSEPKVPRSLDVRHHALPSGSQVECYIDRDAENDPAQVGTSNVAQSYGPASPLTSFAPGDVEAMEFSFILTRPDPDGVDYSRSPELTRWTAKVLPTPSTIDETFTVRIHMKSSVDTVAGDGQPYWIDVPAEVDFLKTLEWSREIVEMQLGDETHDVYVVSSSFQGDHWHSPKREFAEGMLELTMQTVRG